MRALMLAITFALALPAWNAAAQEPATQAEQSSPAELANRFLDHLDAGRYERAIAMFDGTLRDALPADKLKAAWEGVPTQAGPLQGRGEAQVQAADGRSVVTIPLRYEKVELQASIVTDADGRIGGFQIRQAPPPTPLLADPVPGDAAYLERDALVGDGERALPATLAMPKGDGPFPAMVLVHGSGAHDRDETMGPNKPFADIARGLAERGIAVLRYDKRAKVRPQDYADGVTVDSEVTDDAVAAVATLRATPGIDGKRVFVLGHSLGGMMAPRIVTRAKADGMILLAAPSRPVLDLLLEQVRRMAVLDDGKTSAEEAARIAALRGQIAAARSQQEAPASDMPLGQSQAYWRSVEAVDPVNEAVATSVPILILQGARDIQVVDADWQRWKASFDGDRKARLQLYPALNHLGIAGDGPATPAEYERPGKVDAQLIDDVAEWIKAQ